MGLLKKFFTNCAHPKGRMGRAMLKFMNLTHAPLTNWGLGLIGFQDGWTMLDVGCGGGKTIQRLLKRSQGAKVDGMTAYTPEQLKALLDDAGFTQTEIHRKKPMYATILGVKP